MYDDALYTISCPVMYREGSVNLSLERPLYQPTEEMRRKGSLLNLFFPNHKEQIKEQKAQKPGFWDLEF